MLDSIHRFGLALRRAGLPISSDQLSLASQAAAAIELTSRDELRLALRTTMLRTINDQPVFDLLFDAVFALSSDGGPELSRAVNERIGADRTAELSATLSPLAAALLGSAPGDLDSLAEAAGTALAIGNARTTLQTGAVAYRLAAAMELEKAETDVLSALSSLPAGDAEIVAALVRQRTQDIRQALRARAEREIREQWPRRRRELALGQLETRSLASITPDEARELAREVDRLARNLLAARRRRRPRQAHGRLDVAKTLRSAVATDGIPMVPRFNRKRRRKPRLVVLCDISDSVRNVSRFMLQLVYSIARITDGVRSFAFVAELSEITHVFRRHSIDRAIELVGGGAVINVLANSNYGRSIEQFADAHLGCVSSRTTVIVIGDGRTNYHSPGMAALRRIRAKAARLIWLNPEPESIWGFGDSAMNEYRTLCDEVAVVGNLGSLKRLAHDLL